MENSLNLFLCLHLAIKSHIWVKGLPGSKNSIICIFSSRHKLHLPSKQQGVVDFFNIFHWILSVKSLFSKFKNVWIKLFDFSSVQERTNGCDYYILTSLPTKFQYNFFFIFYIFFLENCSLIHFIFQITHIIHRTINCSFTIIITIMIIIIIIIIIIIATIIIFIIFKFVIIYSNYFSIMSVNYFKKYTELMFIYSLFNWIPSHYKYFKVFTFFWVVFIFSSVIFSITVNGFLFKYYVCFLKKIRMHLNYIS